MKLFQILFALFLLTGPQNLTAQSEQASEEDQIKAAISGYIEGTSYNYPERIKSAFMPGANMFLDHKDKPLHIMKAEDYAEMFAKSEPGKFNGRVTNIISIDRFEGIATAKLEVIIPAFSARFIDLLLLKKLESGWKIISKTAGREPSTSKGEKVLLVVSSATKQGKSDMPAGNSFSEVVIAFDGYVKAGYHVDVVSPRGGSAPLSYINPANELQLSYLYNADFMYTMKNTLKPAAVKSSEYAIVQFTGGSAPIFDVPQNEAIQAIAMDIYEKNKGVIAAVCHGTAGLVHLKTADGQYLVKGKTVNGVPDSHESKKLAHYQHYPFIIEDLLKERGGNFKHSEILKPHMEVDGRLVTGQNSLSSEMVTKKSIEISQGEQ